MTGSARLSRLVAWAGLTTAGALHVAWAAGSPWPAESWTRWGEAVVGSSTMLPDPRVTGVVGVGTLVGGALAAGAFGEGETVVTVRRLLGIGLLARAVVGGSVTLEVLGMPPAGARFRELDRRFYRPLFALVGSALIRGART